MTTPTPIRNIEAYSPHDLAKIVNNRAVYQIATTGNYEEGIILLRKALELTGQSILLQNEEDQIPCCCKFCSFESSLVVENDDVEKQKHATIDSSSFDDSIMDCDDTGFHDNIPSTSLPQHVSKHGKKAEEGDDGFVYQRLLLINDHSIEKHHYMGSTLSLIILFNLALTHHLMGIDSDNDKDSSSTPENSTKKLQSLQHALKLYEFAYQLHTDYIEQQSWHTKMDDDDVDNKEVVSLRLTMIVSNNLGQIHRVVGNSKKHALCLQHLLSSIMYMGQQQQRHQLVHNTVLDSTELDEFLRNVSPIVFNDVCAPCA